MKFSVRVIDNSRDSLDQEFLVRQVRRHFEAWQSQAIGSSFLLRWRGHHLVLTTDSEDLVQRWNQIERQYVESLLTANATINDDMSDLVCYPTGRSSNSAA